MSRSTCGTFACVCRNRLGWRNIIVVCGVANAISLILSCKRQGKEQNRSDAKVTDAHARTHINVSVVLKRSAFIQPVLRKTLVFCDLYSLWCECNIHYCVSRTENLLCTSTGTPMMLFVCAVSNRAPVWSAPVESILTLYRFRCQCRYILCWCSSIP